ncbi:hypothetical protein ACFQWC_12460 [Rossellomorea sp. GCM10028870]
MYQKKTTTKGPRVVELKTTKKNKLVAYKKGCGCGGNRKKS